MTSAKCHGKLVAVLSSVMESVAQSITVSEASSETPEVVRRETVVWQQGLLPFMTYFVAMMAVAFFVFSGFHVYEVSRYIKAEEGQDIRSAIRSEIEKPSASQATAAELNDHAVLLLEAETLDRRYHQAGGMLMARIWARQLAFITGMVLAFMGAVFILGKMNDMPTQVSGEGTQFKVAINTASPGLILSFFGTALIIASLFVPSTLDVVDGAAYLGRVPQQAAPHTSGPSTSGKPPASGDQPISLKEMQQMDSKSGKKSTP